MSLRRLLSALALSAAVASSVPACVVSGTARVRGTVAYSQPPPPRDEYVETRPGFVWIQGRWDWQSNQWVWVDGRWERERRGYRYDRGQWVQRGSSWHWVEGNWVAVGTNDGGNVIVTDPGDAPGGVGVVTRPRGDGRGDGGYNSGGGRGDGGYNSGGGHSGGGVVRPAPDSRYPTAPPPPPREERMEQRRGFIWVAGRWDWRGGQWEWIDGHWERQRANKTWIPGRWQLQGNIYVWIEGGWN